MASSVSVSIVPIDPQYAIERPWTIYDQFQIANCVGKYGWSLASQALSRVTSRSLQDCNQKIDEIAQALLRKDRKGRRWNGEQERTLMSQINEHGKELGVDAAAILLERPASACRQKSDRLMEVLAAADRRENFSSRKRKSPEKPSSEPLQLSSPLRLSSQKEVECTQFTDSLSESESSHLLLPGTELENSSTPDLSEAECTCPSDLSEEEFTCPSDLSDAECTCPTGSSESDNDRPDSLATPDSPSASESFSSEENNMTTHNSLPLDDFFPSFQPPSKNEEPLFSAELRYAVEND